MKIKTWLSAWLLSFGISFGVTAAMVTAFAFTEISLEGLAFYCGAVCCLCALVFTTRCSHWIILGAVTVILGYNLIIKDLWQSLLALTYRISILYDSAYSWGTLDVPILTQYASPLSAIRALALLSALLVCCSVCRQKRLLLCLPPALLPLYPCFVVTDTIPIEWSFLLILASVLVLVLSQDLRRRSHRDGNRITAIVLIPAVLLSVLLVGKVPQNGYWSELASLKVLSQYLPSLGHANYGDPAPGMPDGNQATLSTLGPQNTLNMPVMEVKSNFSGYLYLRYQSFDKYSSTKWTATSHTEDPAFWPAGTELESLGSVSISTKQAFDGMFVPYYARSGTYLQLQSGKLTNPESLTQYRFTAGKLPDGYVAAGTSDYSPWLELPASTREAARQILLRQNLQTPEDILHYVQNCADYSLQTGRMPFGEGDFAIWFLEESETGYCVHFATAAAVLLRAAGYPARYVSGYVVQTQRNVRKIVTENLAHAWVEYIDPNRMPFWQIMEATPGFTPEDPNIEPTTEPSQSTEPSTEPNPSTEPSTEPSQSTEPTQNTTLPGNTTPSQSVTRPSTEPTQDPSQPGAAVVDLSWLWTALRYLGILAGVALVLWSQYVLRLRRRWKLQRTGHKNAQALARWQEIRRLGRLLKTPPPKELLELAEKARFSQHILTQEELLSLGQYLQQQRKAVQKLPIFQRIFLKLLWAI